MQSLFWKIFLSVLLTIIVTAVVSVVISFWLVPRPHGMPPGPLGGSARDDDGPRSPREEWRLRFGDLFTLHAPQIENVFAEGGYPAAREHLDQLSATWGLTTYLIDSALNRIDGKELSAEARELARAAQQRDGVQVGGNNNLIIALGLKRPPNESLILVGETPEMSPPPPAVFAWMTMLRVGPVALGLGLASYFLTRYITSPLTQMRTALRKFAQGDLEQRLGSTVGKRPDEIGELARDFDHMAQRIATLLHAQQRLLQDVSHELRSPLARQRVALELVRDNDGPNADRALDRAQREAERLEELIDELLRLSRLESNHAQAARCDVDLAVLIREVIDNAEFETHLGSRGVQITELIPCQIHGVPELLRRAVENIVRNALAYTAEGTTVEIALTQDEHDALIRVCDRGPGVPEAELNDIFRPFYRVSRARERETGGVGLGLAIAARAVHSHGGNVSASNRTDGGLCVELRIPRCLAEHANKNSYAVREHSR